MLGTRTRRSLVSKSCSRPSTRLPSLRRTFAGSSLGVRWSGGPDVRFTRRVLLKRSEAVNLRGPATEVSAASKTGRPSLVARPAALSLKPLLGRMRSASVGASGSLRLSRSTMSQFSHHASPLVMVSRLLRRRRSCNSPARTPGIAARPPGATRSISVRDASSADAQPAAPTHRTPDGSH